MVILLSSYFASKSINFITYHAKFQVKIPTGSPIILTLNFVFEPISLSATRKEKKKNRDRTLRVGPSRAELS